MLDETLDTTPLDQGRAYDLLQELEQNTPDELRRQRSHFRIALKARVIVEPGNASERGGKKLQCVTGDISEGGCRMLSPLPMQVGDIYRLEFDRKAVSLPITYARCMRCVMLREDAFEAGFAFFTAIALPEHADVNAEAHPLI